MVWNDMKYAIFSLQFSTNNVKLIMQNLYSPELK
jgi:hypothetical protein